MKIAIVFTAVLLAGNVAWGAGEEAPADQGKLLFESVKLGTNGKSCAACHPGGKELEWAATFPDDKLADVTNTCVINALKGKPLEENSAEMKSLIRYIKTFAGP